MLRKSIYISLFTIVILLVACSNNENETEEEFPELPELVVEFFVPEHVEVGETIDLTAHVIYDEEPVTDADSVEFEVWTQGNSEDSVFLEGAHQEDGTYTASFTFEEEAVYEMYAHTTANSLHTMPLKSVIVADAEISEEDANDNMDHEHHNEVQEE